MKKTINRRSIRLKIIALSIFASCAHQIPSPVSTYETLTFDYSKELKWKNETVEEVAFDYSQGEFYRLLEFILPKDQNSNYELVDIHISEDSISSGTHSGYGNPISTAITLGIAPMYSDHTLEGQFLVRMKSSGDTVKVPFKISRKYGVGIYYFFKGLFKSDWALGKLPERYEVNKKHSLKNYVRERITEATLSSYELGYQESLTCRENSDCTLTTGALW